MEKNNSTKTSIITQKDVLILKQLFEDGRKSSSSISKEIDLGREIVNYRIKRLIKENLIVKFVPKINEKAMHYREYNILLKLNLEDEASKEKIIKEKIGNKYLMWMIKSNEGWDLMVRLFASSIDEFKIKLAEILEGFSEHLANYYTIITSDEIKEEERKILCEKLFDEKLGNDYKELKDCNQFELDNKDKEILTLLEQDGRVQYKEIASKLEISSDTVKYRIEKMKSQGLIERFDPIINFSKLGYIQFAGIIKFKFLSQKEEEIMENIIKDNKNILRGIKSLNSEEYFVNMIFKQEEEKEKLEENIKKQFGDKIEIFEIFKID